MGAIVGAEDTENNTSNVFLVMNKRTIRLSDQIWINSTKIE